MKKIKIIGVIVILIGLGFAVKQLFSRMKTDDKKDYKTLQATHATIVDEALAIGTITPENEIQVKSKIAGIVVERYVEVGDEVKKGDILIQISPDPTPIELTEARRDLQMKEVALKNTKIQYDRNVELRSKNLVSDEAFESIKLKYDQAKLQRDLSNDRLSLIEKGQAGKIESVVKSPIDGMVLEKFVNNGDPVVPLTSYQQGTPLFTLADMSSLIFRGTIDEIDIGKVNVGVMAELEIGALPGKSILGKIIRMSPKARKENNATVFDIEIKIVDTRGITLRAGYSANAKIIINKAENVLAVPERLLTFQNDSVFVEVEDTINGTISKRPIKIGLSDGISAEVLSGITTEDLLVERPPKEIK
jgi:HlyD family secretion protein